MSRGFDYSKWDRLEVSDDEKDAHPNIDSSLMIRIKREQRARREAEEEMKKSQLRKIGTPEALRQVEEIERKAKLHVDNICRVVDEKTIVNKPTAPPLPSQQTKHSESKFEEQDANNNANAVSDDEDEFTRYVEKHEESMLHYAGLAKLQDSEQFLLDHLEVLNEHACGWMLLHMLSLEMSDERPAMLNATRQYLMLRNIMDLAKEIRRGNDARPMVQLFYKQLKNDKERVTMLDVETHNFAQQIIKRAEQKRIEMQQEQTELVQE